MTLYGIAEIAEALGERRQTVAQWHKRGKLPPPTQELSMGPVWEAKDIHPWLWEKQAEKFRSDPKVRQLIVDLCREAGDDMTTPEEELIDNFRSNHYPDTILRAAAGDVEALAELRYACGLPLTT